MGDPDAFSKIFSAARQQYWLDNAKTMNPMNSGPAARPLSSDQLRTMKVPARVIGGETSRANFWLGNDMLMTCLPVGTKRAVIPQAGHLYAPANPEATAQAILRFIAKH